SATGAGAEAAVPRRRGAGRRVRGGRSGPIGGLAAVAAAAAAAGRGVLLRGTTGLAVVGWAEPEPSACSSAIDCSGGISAATAGRCSGSTAAEIGVRETEGRLGARAAGLRGARFTAEGFEPGVAALEVVDSAPSASGPSPGGLTATATSGTATSGTATAAASASAGTFATSAAVRPVSSPAAGAPPRNCARNQSDSGAPGSSPAPFGIRSRATFTHYSGPSPERG
ncbi:MAG: hypothetical protein RI885_1307, partial [Actinomycetota bacterium]